MLALFTRFRRTRRPAQPRPNDHVAVAVSPPKPDEGHRPTPPPPTPPQPSPALPPGQAWPSPRTWLNAELTPAEKIREGWVLWDLAKLTDDHPPLEAAQIMFAPHLRKDTHA